MRHPVYQTRRKRRSSVLGRLLLWCVILLFALLAVAVIAAPWAVRHGVPYVLSRYGVTVSMDGARVDLLHREVVLEGFRLGDAAAPALAFEEVVFGLDMAALGTGKVGLRHFRVAGVDLDPRRLTTLQWRETPGLRGGAGPSRRGLPVSVDDVDLENVRLAFLSRAIGYDVVIDRLRARGIGKLVPGATADLMLRARLGNAPLTLITKLALGEDAVGLAGDYRLEGIPLVAWGAMWGEEGGERLRGGALHGVGELRAEYAMASRTGDLTLDGTLRVTGIEAVAALTEIGGGDATWRGRIAGRWAVGEGPPALRGEGILEVGRLDLRRRGEQRLEIRDTSWHGDFDWRDGLSLDGSILGGAVEVGEDARPGEEVAWRARAEDYSWRMHAVTTTAPDTFTLRVQDVDMSSLRVRTGNARTLVDVDIDGVAVDEVRAAHTGDFVIGRLAARGVAVRQPSADDRGESVTYAVDDLVAEGMTGGMPGKLQVARMSASSLRHDGAAARIRAEELGMLTFGVSLSGRLGADELAAETVRVTGPDVETWLSELRASRLSGDAGTGLGVDRLTVASVFTAGAGDWSWEASRVALEALSGLGGNAPRADALKLESFAFTGDEALWEAAGLRADELSPAAPRGLRAERVVLDSFEGSSVTEGIVNATGAAANAVRVRADDGADVDFLKVDRLAFRALAGGRWEVASARADRLAIGPSGESRAERLAAERLEGQAVDGTRHVAQGIELRATSTTPAGGIHAEEARVGSAMHRDAAGAEITLDAGEATALRRDAEGVLSADSVQARGVRVVESGGEDWHVEGLEGSALSWRPRDGADMERVAVAHLRHGEEGPDSFRAEGVMAAGIRALADGELEARSVSALAAQAPGDAPAWKVGGIDVRGVYSPGGGTLVLDDAALGKIDLEDSESGARLTASRGRVEELRLDAGFALSARRIGVSGLHLPPRSPDSAAALSAGEIVVADTHARFGEIVELGEISARDVDLIVAQRATNEWLLPVLPFTGTNGADDTPGDAVRVASLTVEGASRVAFVDLVTEPDFRVVLHPVVFVMQDLDTVIAGRTAEFHLEGRHREFGHLRNRGRLVRRLDGFDLELEAELAGIDVTVFAPFMRRNERFVPSAGRADAFLDLVLADGMLNGNADLRLSGLRLEPAGGASPRGRLDPTRVPLDTLVGLLKDRHGNIHLDAPLNARTRRPGFDFFDFFGRTLRTTAELAANVPGTVVRGTVRAVDTATALLPAIGSRNYRAVRFAAGEAHLRAEPLVYLDGVARRLRGDDALRFSLCGKATSADVAVADTEVSALDRRVAEASEGAFATPLLPPDPGVELAEARGEAVRRYLHEAHGIDRERLAACEPEFEASPGALPRVELIVESASAAGVLERLLP